MGRSAICISHSVVDGLRLPLMRCWLILLAVGSHFPHR